mmetsp:Transcript_30947/g.75686  ORF Transcript_30947/g.75686 Transcript_30947/m.75686 type:complete len:286 (-) Transcript_30947:270-1127(-)
MTKLRQSVLLAFKLGPLLLHGGSLVEAEIAGERQDTGGLCLSLNARLRTSRSVDAIRAGAHLLLHVNRVGHELLLRRRILRVADARAVGLRLTQHVGRRRCRIVGHQLLLIRASVRRNHRTLARLKVVAKARGDWACPPPKVRSKGENAAIVGLTGQSTLSALHVVDARATSEGLVLLGNAIGHVGVGKRTGALGLGVLDDRGVHGRDKRRILGEKDLDAGRGDLLLNGVERARPDLGGGGRRAGGCGCCWRRRRPCGVVAGGGGRAGVTRHVGRRGRRGAWSGR